MAHLFVKRRNETNTKSSELVASQRYSLEKKGELSLFYELEAAVVLDVVLDDSHPVFKNKELDPVNTPIDADGNPPKEGQPNYGWIGMIRFRFLDSQVGNKKETLSWARPMENTGITEWPLMNEIVVVGKYLNNYYYTKKLNLPFANINTAGYFGAERVAGRVQQNLDESGKPYEGPLSVLNSGEKNQEKNPFYAGVLGSYFKFNHSIRALKRYEGDSIIESRFGSSIRMGAYDDNRDNDVGLGEYADNGGNPMVLIRNRQTPVKGSTEPHKLISRGYTLEDINKDGSSVQLTSGKTISKFITTTKKSIFSKSIKEEQPMFSPDGSTEFDFPKLDGDQIIINSDRIIISSKANETIHFSKKRYAIATDAEYTVDAHKQIVMTTNEKFVINSPYIVLGEHGEFINQAEPVLLGRTTTAWNMALCDWLLNQTNWMIELCESWLAEHIHDKDSRGDAQKKPITSVQSHVNALKSLREELIALRDMAPSNMSNRVFTVGGGGAPGKNGGLIKGEKTAITDEASAQDESSEDAMTEEEKLAAETPKETIYEIVPIYENGGEKSIV